jgi:hypothetical protein
MLANREEIVGRVAHIGPEGYRIVAGRRKKLTENRKAKPKGKIEKGFAKVQQF